MWNPFKKDYSDSDGRIMYYMGSTGSDRDMVFYTVDANEISIASWIKILRGEKSIDKGLVYIQKHGDTLMDVMDFGFCLSVVSPKFLQILINSNVAGWKSDPVTLQLKNGDKVEGYHVLQILGRCTTFMKQEFDEPYFQIVKEWDGSDIVVIGDTSAIAVTPRVKDLLEANNITGVSFKKVLVLKD